MISRSEGFPRPIGESFRCRERPSPKERPISEELKELEPQEKTLISLFEHVMSKRPAPEKDRWRVFVGHGRKGKLYWSVKQERERGVTRTEVRLVEESQEAGRKKRQRLRGALSFYSHTGGSSTKGEEVRIVRPKKTTNKRFARVEMMLPRKGAEGNDKVIWDQEGGLLVNDSSKLSFKRREEKLKEAVASVVPQKRRGSGRQVAILAAALTLGSMSAACSFSSAGEVASTSYSPQTTELVEPAPTAAPALPALSPGGGERSLPEEIPISTPEGPGDVGLTEDLRMEIQFKADQLREVGGVGVESINYYGRWGYYTGAVDIRSVNAANPSETQTVLPIGPGQKVTALCEIVIEGGENLIMVKYDSPGWSGQALVSKEEHSRRFVQAQEGVLPEQAIAERPWSGSKEISALMSPEAFNLAKADLAAELKGTWYGEEHAERGAEEMLRWAASMNALLDPEARTRLEAAINHDFTDSELPPPDAWYNERVRNILLNGPPIPRLRLIDLLAVYAIEASPADPGLNSRLWAEGGEVGASIRDPYHAHYGLAALGAITGGTIEGNYNATLGSGDLSGVLRGVSEGQSGGSIHNPEDRMIRMHLPIGYVLRVIETDVGPVYNDAGGPRIGNWAAGYYLDKAEQWGGNFAIMQVKLNAFCDRHPEWAPLFTNDILNSAESLATR